MKIPLLSALLLILPACASTPASVEAPATVRKAVEFPGRAPGTAFAKESADDFILENAVISASWRIKDGALEPASIGNRLSGDILGQSGRVLFRLSTDAGVTLDSSAFRIESAPCTVALAAGPAGVRLADRIGGVAFECTLVHRASGIRVRWHAELHDGSNYIRQTLAFEAMDGSSVGINAVTAEDIHLPGAKTVGAVPGCPILGDGLFAGVEMPGAKNELDADGARIGFPCKLVLAAGQPYAFTSVLGVAPQGQERRAFLYYIERERARPSSAFLHYNSWYDFTEASSAEAVLDAARAFNRELTKKRGIPVKSCLLDDGWDDVTDGLWKESVKRFPGGFKALKAQLDKEGMRLGIWISPLGGYFGVPERVGAAKAMGILPADAAGLDLSHPGYKRWFEERCLTLMKEGGVNTFKWDKAGEGVSPHFMALLDVAHDLRKADPSVFINVTVGTWPSPFWLNHIDTTWRNGSADVGFSGKGHVSQNPHDRERWLTFRDGQCHRLFVAASPLYPLNSVMHHGIVHGRAYQGGEIGSSNAPDLANEARSYFANGASLQELYLSPSLMTPAAWDAVADAARWARANGDVLVDAHWVGGDPLKSEIYGYAAWNTRKGTLMLRNPDDKEQTFSLDIGQALNLPPDAPKDYLLSSPYPDQRVQSLKCGAAKPVQVTLHPFEVLVFDAWAGR